MAGAIYAGFAMVLTLAIPLRKAYGLEDFITMKHIENMAKVMLATGLIVGYGYMIEAFMAWYSGNTYERFMMWNRMTGPMGWTLLDAHPLQRGRDQHAVGEAAPHERGVPLPASRSWSAWACGSSGSSSS